MPKGGQMSPGSIADWFGGTKENELLRLSAPLLPPTNSPLLPPPAADGNAEMDHQQQPILSDAP